MKSLHSRAAALSQTALAGIALMIFACLVASGAAALAKAVLLAFPIAQVLLIRSLSALAFGAPFARPADFKNIPRPGLQLFRFGICAVEAPMYFYAISHLPLVDVMTYYMAAPIYVTAASATILGEPVGWRRWSAVLIGFVGVLIALRPSSAMLSVPALVALGGSLLYGAMLTSARVLRGTRDIVLVATQLSGVLIFAVIMAPMNWLPLALGDLVLIASLGIGTLITSASMNRSLKLAPASVVVPYQYMLIVGAAFFGYVFFGEKPELTTLIGAAIIIGAGIYIFMRELKVAPKPPVVETP